MINFLEALMDCLSGNNDFKKESILDEKLAAFRDDYRQIFLKLW